MSALWLKTAREEEDHARQIEMVMRRRNQMDARVKGDLKKAAGAVEMVETLIAAAMLKTSTIHDALEEAITLENTLPQFHADSAVGFEDETYQKLFASMMAADRDHVGLLQVALDRLAQRR